MEKGIYRYVLRHSARQQIVLTLMAMASFPFLYAFYELPKQIVNEAILAQTIAFPVELFGTELGQIDYLFLLAALFLLLVFFNQCFKYAINVYRGRTGERMLRRLRYDLYSYDLYSRGAAFPAADLPQDLAGRGDPDGHRRGRAAGAGSSAMRSRCPPSRAGR